VACFRCSGLRFADNPFDLESADNPFESADNPFGSVDNTFGRVESAFLSPFGRGYHAPSRRRR